MADRFALVAQVLSAELARPYAYGEADCFLLGCRIADALAPGLGLAARYRGAYTTLAGAQRALRRRGCASIGDLLARHLAPCAPAECRLGDIAVMVVDGGEHVAVCLGARFRTKTPQGARDLGFGTAVAGFRTGARP